MPDKTKTPKDRPDNPPHPDTLKIKARMKSLNKNFGKKGSVSDNVNQWMDANHTMKSLRSKAPQK